MKSTLLTVFMLFALCCISFSQTGILDNSFGTNGIVITNIKNSTADLANGLVVQPDNKIVVAGSTDYIPADYSDFAVVRYLQNGNLDSSFGINGKVTTDIISQGFSRENQCNAVGLQADGKIIAGGYYQHVSNSIGNYDVLIIRYKTNGQLDSTFGTNGKATVDIPNYNDYVYSLAIQKDGRILVGGKQDGQDSLTGQSQEYFELIRFNSNGSIDSTFGNNGIIITTRIYFSSITSLVIQPDGKIIASGNGDGANGSSDFVLARYLQNGKLDSSFGTNGIVTTDLSVKDSSIANEYAYGVDLQEDGKIIVVGQSGNIDITPPSLLVIARYNSNGKLDSTFNSSGIIKGNYNNEFSKGKAVAIEKDGKVIVTGLVMDSGRASFLVARYKQNGSTDSTFGNNGFTITHFLNDAAEPSTVGFQSDGKIIVGGTDYYSYNGDFALARYNNDAILPINFASFTAIKNNQSVILNWSTCNEINNKGFYVERGGTTNSWIDIGFVSAKDLTKGCNDYSFTDSNPLAGNNFYRIKQVDNDGKFLFSKTINIIFKESSITLSPNPAKGILTIKGLGNNNSILFITDVSGKSVSRTQTADDTFDWNIQTLPAGNYFLVALKNDQIVASIKFIKE